MEGQSTSSTSLSALSWRPSQTQPMRMLQPGFPRQCSAHSRTSPSMLQPLSPPRYSQNADKTAQLSDLPYERALDKIVPRCLPPGTPKGLQLHIMHAI